MPQNGDDCRDRRQPGEEARHDDADGYELARDGQVSGDEMVSFVHDTRPSNLQMVEDGTMNPKRVMVTELNDNAMR